MNAMFIMWGWEPRYVVLLDKDYSFLDFGMEFQGCSNFPSKEMGFVEIRACGPENVCHMKLV